MNKKAFLMQWFLYGQIFVGNSDINYFNKVENETPTLIRLDFDNNIKKASDFEFTYELSNDVDCYVIDNTVLSQLQVENATDYIKNGGFVIINERKVNIDDFVEKFSIDTGYGGLLDLDNTYATLVYNNQNATSIINYTIDFVDDSLEVGYEYEIDDEKLKFGFENFDMTQFFNDILLDINNKKFSDFFDNGINTEKTAKEEKDPEKIGEANLVGFTYTFFGKIKTGSYRMHAEIYQGQRYYDKDSKKKRTIYDVITEFGVDAEPDYAVYYYEPKIQSSSEILDYSFIESGVTQTITLGGELGFEGRETGAKISFSNSYTGKSTDQDVINNFPFGMDYCTWCVTPYSLQYNGTHYLYPAIRIISDDDKNIQSASLSLENLMFKRKFIYKHLRNEDRKTLKINWKHNEYISQEEI